MDVRPPQSPRGEEKKGSDKLNGMLILSRLNFFKNTSLYNE